MAEFVLNEFRGVFKRAEELYNEEKYKDAVPLFRDVVEHDRDNYIACYYLADCLYYAKGTSRDYKKAFELFMIAASNKLTEDEKKQIDDLIKQITDEDNTIDISE